MSHHGSARAWVIAGGSLLAAAMAVFGWLAWQARQASDLAASGLEELATASRQFVVLDLGRARDSSERASRDLAQAAERLETAMVLRLGGDAALDELAHARGVAQGLAAISERTLQALGQAPDPASLSAQDRSRILSVMDRASGDEAQRASRSIRDLGQLRQAGLGSLLGLARSGQEAVRLAAMAGAILESDREFLALVLLQNNHELRPGGGFIGSYALVRIGEDGISMLELDDSYNLDRHFAGELDTVPPEPLRDYLGVEAWYFRDANWSPDFAVSAKKALELYALEQGPRARDIDAVVSVDTDLARDVLAVIGPVEARGITFEPGSLVDVLQYQVEQAYAELGIAQEDRKDILGEVASAVLDRATRASAAQKGQLAAAFVDALDERHAQLYFHDPDLQAMAESQGWAGRVPETGHDFVMVVDANLGSLKTDRLIERSYAYSLRWDGTGRPVAELSLTYENNGFFDYRTTRYQNFLRVYVPRGSELLDSTGAMAPVERSEDLGKAVLGTFVSIEPGQSRTVTLVYELPEELAHGMRERGYELLWRKQAGTDAPRVTVDLSLGAREDRFETELERDQRFSP